MVITRLTHQFSSKNSDDSKDSDESSEIQTLEVEVDVIDCPNRHILGVRVFQK
jgi:hypothetical protein